MRITAVLLAIASVILLSAIPAEAGSRVALVVGNSAYVKVAALPNPVNDASDISESLKRLGFDVKTVLDARYDEFRRALIEFGQKAAGADYAVFYFAGHGMQIAGENWLLPVDAELATDLNIANEAMGLQSVVRGVSNSRKLGLVILDACRNNPFFAKMRATNVSRDVQRGFSRVEPSGSVMIAYAARDGTTASDGNGRNSPFTGSLLKNIEKPGLEIRFLFANVHDEVRSSTNNRQEPYTYGALSSERIYLRDPGPGAPSEAANAPAKSRCEPYTATVDSTTTSHTTPTVTVNVAYLDAHPGCAIAKVDYKIIRQSNFSELKIAYENNRRKAKVTYNLADRPSPGFAKIEFVVSQSVVE